MVTVEFRAGVHWGAAVVSGLGPDVYRPMDVVENHAWGGRVFWLPD